MSGQVFVYDCEALKSVRYFGYMLHNETIAFSWNTPEFDFKEKRKDWYWIVGIVAVILIIVAIILGNYLFAFLIVIGAFLMVRLATKEPLSLPVEISESGIKVYDQMYRYDDIYSYWITNNKKGQPLLLVLSNQRISPILSLTIDPDIDLVDLREYLGQFLPEQELQEPLTDRIIERIGF